MDESEKRIIELETEVRMLREQLDYERSRVAINTQQQPAWRYLGAGQWASEGSGNIALNQGEGLI